MFRLKSKNAIFGFFTIFRDVSPKIEILGKRTAQDPRGRSFFFHFRRLAKKKYKIKIIEIFVFERFSPKIEKCDFCIFHDFSLKVANVEKRTAQDRPGRSFFFDFFSFGENPKK